MIDERCQWGEDLRCVRCGYQARKLGQLRICKHPDAAKPRGVFDRISSYGTALARWFAAGRPVRNDAEVERLLAICEPCEYYRDGTCQKCGCRVSRSASAWANKLRMATEACPIGLWGELQEPAPREMTIGIIVPNMLCGGVEWWAATLAKYLPRYGVRVAGIAYTGERNAINESMAAELAKHCPIAGAVASPSVHRVLSPTEAIYAVSRGASALLVWSLSGRELDAAAATQLPLIGVSHGCGDWWMRNAAERIDKWVAVSEAAARPVPGSGTIIPNGIDLDRLEPTLSREAVRAQAGIPQAARVVVSVGRLSREKRLDLAARALAELPAGWLLWLVGDGADRERIEQAAGAHAGRLIVSPARADIGNVYEAADVALILSEAEGYGLAPVEALAAGLPLVATSVGILPELDHQCRFTAASYVPTNPTPEQVAHAIVGATSTPQDRREAVAAIIRREHSADAMARRWAAFLASAVPVR